jgi:REP element-mobilizing transposase RayT
MALHSYSRCWVHLIWGTLNREKVLNKEAAARVSHYLHEYAETKSLYMKINYVNADHVHALVDLPNWSLNRGGGAIIQRKFVSLDQRK